MAESASGGTSIGKISLDIEMGGNLKEQMMELTQNLQKQLSQTMQQPIKKLFEDMAKSMTDSLRAITDEVRNMMAASKKELEDYLKQINNVKMPTMPAPGDTTQPSQETPGSGMPRAPPASVSFPKLKIDFDIEQQKELINNQLAQIEIQMDLLKNKSNELEDAMQKALKTDPAAADEIELKLKQIGSQMVDLEIKSDALQSKLISLSSTGNKTSGFMSGFSSVLQSAKSQIAGLMRSLPKFNLHLKNTGKHAGSSRFSFKRLLGTLVVFRLLMPAITKGIQSMFSTLSQSLQTNDQFNRSLKQVKSNLSVAFTPIFQAILPAVNALMAGLSKLTAYLAAFTSTLFGSSLSASVAATKQLNAQKQALSGVGGAAKKASLQLASFDELNIIGQKEDAGAVLPEITMPEINTSGISDFAQKLKDLIDAGDWFGIGALFGEQLYKALDSINWSKIKVKAGKIGKNIANLINGFITFPDLGYKIGESIAEAFNTALSFAYNFISTLDWGALGKFIGDGIVGFIQNIDWSMVWDTIVEGLKGVIIFFYELITTTLSGIGQMNPALEILVTLIGSFFAIMGTLNIIIPLFETFIALWTFLTNPIGLVIVAITALIAGLVLLITHWDQIKTAAVNCWNWIQKTWKGACDWVKKTVIDPIWDNFKAFYNWLIGGFEGFVNGAIRGVNGIIDALNSISFTIPSWVPVIGGNTWSLNLPRMSEITLPRLAKGGLIDQPTLAMVGESGKEAVMPLENNTGWIDQLADRVAARLPQGNSMTSAQLDLIIELLRQLLEKSGDVYLMDEIVGIIGEAWDRTKGRRGDFAFNGVNR